MRYFFIIIIALLLAVISWCMNLLLSLAIDILKNILNFTDEMETKWLQYIIPELEYVHEDYDKNSEE